LIGAGAWFAEGTAWLQQPVRQSDAELVIGQSGPISLMPIAHCKAAGQAQTANAGCAKSSAMAKAAIAGNERLMVTTTG
jgi:hypothetical protein